TLFWARFSGMLAPSLSTTTSPPCRCSDPPRACTVERYRISRRRGPSDWLTRALRRYNLGNLKSEVLTEFRGCRGAPGDFHEEVGSAGGNRKPCADPPDSECGYGG